MLIKFLSHGRGSGRKAAQYLLGEYDHTGEKRGEVRVLRGNPLLVGQVCDTLHFIERYRSGVIAWHLEDDPTDLEIETTLQAFERVAFAGLDPSQYLYAAVLHVGKDGSKHIHVLIPRIELVSRKSFNPSPPGWAKYYGPLQAHLNHLHGWARPDDPARRRLITSSDGSRQGRIRQSVDMATVLQVEPDTRRAIEEHAQMLVLSGQVDTRDDLVERLQAFGSITRQGQDYISIKPEGGKVMRFKGGIFDAQADYQALRRRPPPSRPTRATRRRDVPDPIKAQAHLDELEVMRQKRVDYISKRYPTTEGEHDRTTDHAGQPRESANAGRSEDHPGTRRVLRAIGAADRAAASAAAATGRAVDAVRRLDDAVHRITTVDRQLMRGVGRYGSTE